MKTPIQKHKEQTMHRLADQIAAMLGESEASARRQLYYLLMILGKESVFELLRVTLTIEQAGGMLSRSNVRRSPGGVFFQLIKKEPYKSIMQDYRLAHRRPCKMQAPNPNSKTQQKKRRGDMRREESSEHV